MGTHRNTPAIATINLTQSQEFKYEYYLTFDLGEKVQLSQTSISFSLKDGVIPLSILLEGNKESPFPTVNGSHSTTSTNGTNGNSPDKSKSKQAAAFQSRKNKKGDLKNDLNKDTH